MLAAPTVSDPEYDALLRELSSLETEHPELVTPESPTQRVGGKVADGFAKVKHVKPMMSLDNSYSADDLREFDRRVREGLRDDEIIAYVCEPKIDGASLEVAYRGGRLAFAATRGDGEVGEDVTANVRTIRGLPTMIDDRRDVTVRGEVLIHRKDFDAVNEQRVSAGEEPWMNPRNAAAGSLRLNDPALAAQRPLRVFFYDLVEPLFATQTAMLAGLAGLGLPTHRREHRVATLDEALAFIGRFDRERKQLAYETDGVVLKLDDFAQRDRLGMTARFPRWAIAYKFAPERATTTVVAIHCDVGRTGALTPVAELKSVILSGTTVTHASLHNVDWMAKMDVRVGDTVEVEKAGEIIPQVVAVQTASRPAVTEPWRAPAVCPICATGVKKEDGVAALRCPNVACPGRVQASLFYFTRRSGMDIEGIGWSLVEQLGRAGLVRDVADIFALRDRRAELVALERMGEKSVDNLLASIDEARTGRTLARLLTALGIPLVGEVAGTLVARRYRNLRALLDTPPDRLAEELGEIHGIGEKIADAVANYFRDEQQRGVLEKLLRLGVKAEEPAPPPRVEGPLTGSTFCVTGVLTQPREVIHERIRAAGGEVHETVKKGTTYLVAGAKVGAAKLETAKKRGTKVIDETMLEALMRGEAPT